MRKVSREVISAFLAGKSKTIDNTHCSGGGLYLHGNQIASNVSGVIRIFDGGFASATTKERLNALLQLMEYERYEMVVDGVFQKNFRWFLIYNNGEKTAFQNGKIVGVKK